MFSVYKKQIMAEGVTQGGIERVKNYILDPILSATYQKILTILFFVVLPPISAVIMLNSHESDVSAQLSSLELKIIPLIQTLDKLNRDTALLHSLEIKRILDSGSSEEKYDQYTATICQDKKSITCYSNLTCNSTQHF